MATESLKDSAESIVTAFILAFIFRAFVVEAFVIPTGSMAATLYGKHGTLICSDCGWENAYGLTDLASHRRPRYGAESQVRCQNCNHVNTDLAVHDGRLAGGGRSHSNAEQGDRILVFKWPLDTGIDALKPARWEVVVFKNPSEPSENLIKRLVGKPGEVLEIIDGDVYAADVETLSQRALDTLEELLHIKHRRGMGLPAPSTNSIEITSRRAVMLNELSDKLRIRRKTPEAQQALWTVVYDHDYPPRTLDPGQPFWKPVRSLPTAGARANGAGEGTWTTDNRLLSFAAPHGGSGTLVFSGEPIVDHNAYNIASRSRRIGSDDGNPVSDLRLEAVMTVNGGDGFVELALSKYHDEFVLHTSAAGDVRVQHRPASGEPRQLFERRLPPFKPDKPVEIAFDNVDYRVSVEVDGRQLFATTHEQYRPDIQRLREANGARTRPPRILANNIDVTLSHVVLLRDVYYTSATFERDSASRLGRLAWGTAKNPILLRDNEYFMLGDNSPASKDARLWDSAGQHLSRRGEAFQLGTIPLDQMVGRAFFVYWPSGLRPEWVPVLRNYGIVPNVGRMRWIR